MQNQSQQVDPGAVEFRFMDFNRVRARRRKPAARVAVIEDGEERWLWMSRADLGRNITSFGKHAELVKALAAYDE